MRAIFFTALLCFAAGYTAGLADGLAMIQQASNEYFGLSN